MLNRQKILLSLLLSGRRPVSRIELTKWAFLLREETPSRGGSSFYDFLPYRYGPFSFTLFREMDGLNRDGYVALAGDSNWSATQLAGPAVQSLARNVRSDGQAVVERFGSKRTDELIEYVYRRYPHFTVNSERQRLAQRVVAAPAVYTAGYERQSVDSFLDRLIGRGIQRIIDVRNNPVARRYGFHKSTLSRLAERIQIEYVHVPELGIESEHRRVLNTERDYEALFGMYTRDTIVRELQAVDRVARLIQEKASVLVCMEADPRFCHRSRLAQVLSGRTSLPVNHLGYDET